jgi:hypothetical protein
MQKILKLANLRKHYPILGGVLRREVDSVKALDGVDLNIYRGECLGLVGVWTSIEGSVWGWSANLAVVRPRRVRLSSVFTILPMGMSITIEMRERMGCGWTLEP